MDSSKLLEGWKQFQGDYPDSAAAIKKNICALYESRHDSKKFDFELARLQEALIGKPLEMLEINVSDKQALATWASAMGLIFLVKTEHKLTGRHA